MPDCVVIKVGGSLYDMPDLKARLTLFLESCAERRILIVPGGGEAAEVVRNLDRRHRLGAQPAHWLALRMLRVNGHFLEQLIPWARVVASPEERGTVAILDAYAFARADESAPNHLPHTWDASSDSVALRAAQVAGAKELVLLKSVTWEGNDWKAATEEGIVDRFFPTALSGLPSLHVRVFNLRRTDFMDWVGAWKRKLE